MKLSSVICVMHKVRVSISNKVPYSQSAQFTFVSFVSVDLDFYSDIRIFFRRIYGGKNSAADSASRIFFG